MTATLSASAEKFIAKFRDRMSGGPVPMGFSEGWATHPFVGKMKAHHWRADRSFDFSSPAERRTLLAAGAYNATSTCGIVTIATQDVPLLGPGNLERCRRCDSVRARWHRLGRARP